MSEETLNDCTVFSNFKISPSNRVLNRRLNVFLSLALERYFLCELCREREANSEMAKTSSREIDLAPNAILPWIAIGRSVVTHFVDQYRLSEKIAVKQILRCAQNDT